MTRLIEQGLNAPHCPWVGYDGGPVHPAHAVEVDIANRVYAVTNPIIEHAADVETVQALEQATGAASRTARMHLYEVEADPVRSNLHHYYVGHYFRCLVCGFVLPAQAMPR